MRFTGCPVASERSGSSPGTPTIRCAVTRVRVMAARLSPRFSPKGDPVSWGAANGSYPSFVQSASIALPSKVIVPRYQS